MENRSEGTALGSHQRQRSIHLYESERFWFGKCTSKIYAKSKGIFESMRRVRDSRGIIIPRRRLEERAVRSAAHAMGLRFRLMNEEMPGHPHLVFPRHRLALFVCNCEAFNHDCRDGHRYDNVRLLHRSAAHARKKLDAVVSVLTLRGWRAGTIWTCEAVDPAGVQEVLRSHFGLLGDEISQY